MSGASARRCTTSRSWQTLLNPKVLALALVYFGAVALNYGLSFFLPQIVKGFGLSNLQTGFVTAIPYVVGTVAMVWWGRRSDRKLERKGHCGVRARRPPRSASPSRRRSAIPP